MFALCRCKHQGSIPRATPGNFGQTWATPYWFERRRHSIANCGRMVTYSATVTMENLSLFWMVPSLTPYDRPFPKIGAPYAPKNPRYANGHISSMGDPIHFMFGSRLGFQGWRIEWRYFLLHEIQVGGRPPSWIISNGHISATAYSIHLYSAHHAVIFAIAQLACWNGSSLTCL